MATVKVMYCFVSICMHATLVKPVMIQAWPFETKLSWPKHMWTNMDGLPASCTNMPMTKQHLTVHAQCKYAASCFQLILLSDQEER